MQLNILINLYFLFESTFASKFILHQLWISLTINMFQGPLNIIMAFIELQDYLLFKLDISLLLSLLWKKIQNLFFIFSMVSIKFLTNHCHSFTNQIFLLCRFFLLKPLNQEWKQFLSVSQVCTISSYSPDMSLIC